MRARILNKTKETVTYVVVGLKMSPKTEKWEEFLKIMDSTSNPFIYESKPEVDKEAKEKIEMLTQLLPIVLSGRVVMNEGGVPSMVNAMMLGDISQKYCEKFKCSPMQFIEEYRTFEKASLERMMQDGIGVGKVHRDAHHIKGRDVRRARETIGKSIDTPDSNMCSIGDILKAKGEKK